MALRECFRLLGLDPSARPQDVQAKFRRLAKAYHPDVQRTAAGGPGFVRVVQAYKTIQRTLHRDGVEQPKRRCPACGRLTEVFDSADGGSACADCLLGTTRRRFTLPFPSMETVKHLTVIGLEVLSVCLLMMAVGTGSIACMLASLASAGLAIFALAITCVRVQDTA